MIYIIYTDAQYEKAEEISDFLVEDKKLTVYSSEEGCIILNSDDRIDQDAAIVLISDFAVKDERWQGMIQALSQEIRIIPVNSTRNADYTEPELIPEKIRELNYIYIDENYFNNIWDCLVVEKSFYDIKNMILVNRSVWIFSKFSADFLLTNEKEVKQYLLLFLKKIREERDAYFREEISGIIDYLKISLQYIKILKNERNTNYIKRIIGSIVLIIYGIIFFSIINRNTRFLYSDIVMWAGVYGEVAPINCVKLVDNLRNPVISDQVKLETYNKISEHLDLNWHNTPVGGFYKWTINDAQIAADERYIWSANENGNIAKWDTYTGEIVEQEKVSSRPLWLIASSEEDAFFVVVDYDGYIYKKSHGNSWEKSEETFEIPPQVGTEMLYDGKQNFLAITGADGALLYFDCQQGFNLLGVEQYDKIFCAEISDSGLEAVVCKEGVLYDVCIKENGSVDEITIPINWYNNCSMDILNGAVVMADEHFQIVTWSREYPEKVETAGMVLSLPIHLCYFNENVIVYNDRNTGIHLYDLSRKLDLGNILENVVDVSFLTTYQNTVMAYSSASSTCYTENVESLLPVSQINSDKMYVYREKEMTSDGMIRQVSIENEYIIRAILHRQGEEEILITDGARRYFVGELQRDSSLVEDEVFSYYIDSPVSFVGKPTVVGIVNGGETLLAGSSDGSFFEVTYTNTNAFLKGAQRQIPSHAAIVAIYQTDDYYYLEDVTGTFWKTRIGYKALTEEGVIEAVREKLHCAAYGDVGDTVSKDTLEALDVKIMPGNGYEVWE